MATAAFEQITSRLAMPAAAAINKYEAAEIGAAGTIVKGTGAGIFVGVVQYGAAAAGDMVTVVQGIFPVQVSANVTKGQRLKVDADNPGKFEAAANTDNAVAIAVMDIATGTTGSALLVASPKTA